MTALEMCVYYEGRFWRAIQDRQGFVLSGADQVQSELFRLAARATGEIHRGADPDKALADLDRAWRAFSVEQNKKVKDATRLPGNWGYSGLSSMHHRWADPDAATSEIRWIRANLVRVSC